MTRRFSKPWSRLQALLLAMGMSLASYAPAAEWMQHVPVPSLELQEITPKIEVQLTSEYRSIKAYDRHLSIHEIPTEISKASPPALNRTESDDPGIRLLYPRERDSQSYGPGPENRAVRRRGDRKAFVPRDRRKSRTLTATRASESLLYHPAEAR